MGGFLSHTYDSTSITYWKHMGGLYNGLQVEGFEDWAENIFKMSVLPSDAPSATSEDTASPSKSPTRSSAKKSKKSKSSKVLKAKKGKKVKEAKMLRLLMEPESN